MGVEGGGEEVENGKGGEGEEAEGKILSGKLIWLEEGAWERDGAF